MGTANVDAGGAFLRACAEAMAARPEVFAVIADPAGAVTSRPVNVLTVEHVLQLELLPRVSAVICHSGQNTVCESLFHGIPLVLAPIRDGQPIVARARAGRSVAAGDRAAFIAAAAEMRAGHALRQEMGAAGRAYAEATFDVGAVTARFTEVFASVVSTQRKVASAAA